MKCPAFKFKRTRKQLEQGVESAIQFCVGMARTYCKDARQYHAKYRAGDHYWFHYFLGAQGMRRAYMASAKQMKKYTMERVLR